MAYTKQVNAQQAAELLKQGAGLIDVREPAEYNSGHIANAALKPLAGVSASDLEPFNEETVVIYCQKGVRGNKACAAILSENPKANIVNMSGGIEAWQQAGFATQKAATNVMPLQRQSQIANGSLLLMFSLLSMLANENFIYVVLVLSAGLLLAGLFGFCATARLLALAPWNK